MIAKHDDLERGLLPVGLLDRGSQVEMGRYLSISLSLVVGGWGQNFIVQTDLLTLAKMATVQIDLRIYIQILSLSSLDREYLNAPIIFTHLRGVRPQIF